MEDPTPYIREAEDKITKPAICAISGEELELSSNDIVYLNENYRPLSNEYKNQAKYVATISPAYGHPWNGIHPETGETQSLESTEWWDINIDELP